MLIYHQMEKYFEPSYGRETLCLVVFLFLISLDPMLGILSGSSLLRVSGYKEHRESREQRLVPGIFEAS